MSKLTLLVLSLSGIGFMIAVFYHNEGQRRLAEKSREEQAAR